MSKDLAERVRSEEEAEKKNVEGRALSCLGGTQCQKLRYQSLLRHAKTTSVSKRDFSLWQPLASLLSVICMAQAGQNGPT